MQKPLFFWEVQKRTLSASSSCSSRLRAAIQTSLFMGVWEVGAASSQARGRPAPAAGRERGSPSALNAACVPAAVAAHNEPFQGPGAGPACEHRQPAAGLGALGVSVPFYKPSGISRPSPVTPVLQLPPLLRMRDARCPWASPSNPAWEEGGG